MLRTEPVYKTFRRLTFTIVKSVLSKIRLRDLSVISLTISIFDNSTTADKASYFRLKAILIKARQYYYRIIDELIKSTLYTANISCFIYKATNANINNTVLVLRGLIYILIK
jgi:hypothetical protein